MKLSENQRKRILVEANLDGYQVKKISFAVDSKTCTCCRNPPGNKILWNISIDEIVLVLPCNDCYFTFKQCQWGWRDLEL